MGDQHHPFPKVFPLREAPREGHRAISGPPSPATPTGYSTPASNNATAVASQRLHLPPDESPELRQQRKVDGSIPVGYETSNQWQ